jgi:hypothetical protein
VVLDEQLYLIVVNIVYQRDLAFELSSSIEWLVQDSRSAHPGIDRCLKVSPYFISKQNTSTGSEDEKRTLRIQ